MNLFRFVFAIAALLFSLNASIAAPFTAYSETPFQEAVKTKPVVVHVHAGWCPTCRSQKTALDPILAEPAFAGVAAYRTDYDNDTAFNKANKVTSQSTIIVFKNGKEVARSSGEVDAGRLRALVSKAL